MSVEFLRRPCPTCGLPPEKSKVAARSRVPAETLSLDELNHQWSGFFKEKSFFTYNRCDGCGLLYAPVYFTEAQLQNLYSSMADNTAGLDRAPLKKTQAGYFKELLRRRPGPGEYLEIGPDIGLFTECAAETGDFSKFWLFEPNANVHRELAASVRGQPFEIRTELLDLSSVPPGRVRAAVMVHVLDHILEPAVFLRELRKRLPEKALLLVVTHNERSLMPKLIGSRWPAYCLQHPQLFNPASMRAMMRATGFGDTEVTRSVNHFPVTYLASHLAFALGFKGLKIPPYNGLYLPLKLGNILTTACALPTPVTQ